VFRAKAILQGVKIMLPKDFIRHIVKTQKNLTTDHLTNAVRALSDEVNDINQCITASTGSVLIKCGAASIELKRDGTIKIKGKDISIEGTGKVDVKAGGQLILKGSKIQQN
jgi:hypothetical protein